jgi:hypothetical protein
MNRVEQYEKVQKEAIKLFKKKNADYGDAFATFGPVGVIVRMGDKINRLNSVTRSGITMIDTESVRDTLVDLHNYAAMAVMLLDEDVKSNNIQNKRVTQLKKRQISPTFQETQKILKNKNSDKM